MNGGVATDWWGDLEIVREVNSFLHQAGPALIGWDNRDLARYRDGALLTGASPTLAPVGQGVDLVIGTFARGSKRRVVIANDSFEKSMQFTFAFTPGWRAIKIIASLDAKSNKESSLRGPWMLEPGGCLVIELRP